MSPRDWRLRLEDILEAIRNKVSNSAATRAWARVIKQVYEVDPLMCPRCTGPMRSIALLNNPKSLERSSPTSGCGPPTSTVRPRGYPLPYPLQQVSLPRNQLAIAPSPGMAGRRGRDPRLPGASSMRATSP